MDAINAVVEGHAMIATFPIKMQASIADANEVTGEDSASTVVTVMQ